MANDNSQTPTKMPLVAPKRPYTMTIASRKISDTALTAFSYAAILTEIVDGFNCAFAQRIARCTAIPEKRSYTLNLCDKVKRRGVNSLRAPTTVSHHVPGSILQPRLLTINPYIPALTSGCGGARAQQRKGIISVALKIQAFMSDKQRMAMQRKLIDTTSRIKHRMVASQGPRGRSGSKPTVVNVKKAEPVTAQKKMKPQRAQG